ncbi:MAG: hypothetical protein NC121_04725 [Blautia sp.]|nr:hypothetical protein [Blautia sp.]
MTGGTLMFYGGIAGCILFLLLLVIVLATAGKSRRRLLNRIQKEGEL